MKKDRFYFSHDYSARNDRKLVRLRLKHKMQGLGIYWCVVEMMYEEGGKIALTEVPTIAEELRVKTEVLASVLFDFDLFVKDDLSFWSESVSRRLEKRNEKSEKAKLSAQGKWSANENSSTRSQRLSEARQKGRHTKAQWEEMREWFGECVKCGSTEDIVKDHIIPIYQGGSDGLDNLQPLCRTCNCAKGPENEDYRKEWCKTNACEMPASWKRMPAIKERKGKENKGKESKGESTPTPEQVREYFLEKGYTEESALKAYDYYSSAGWKDSKGNIVRNWKQKMIAVWFKDENRKAAVIPMHDQRKVSNYDPSDPKNSW